MAGHIPDLKEDREMPEEEELCPGSGEQGQQSQEMAEMVDRGTQSLDSAPQEQQKLPTDSADIPQPLKTSDTTKAKNKGSQASTLQLSKEPGRGQQCFRSVSVMQAQHEGLDSDFLAEIGFEELSGVEIELMRRQMQVITERLQELEGQGHSWHYKETVFFTILLSACLVNLWLWMRH
ncbi:PREDICTED: fetal and adult testis-expressed transcript protein homolog [Elephantulus edwardii]|uniref:fetal and adult testis-expressed transcript protein homolog n=1 Tax=Elephantulus edwardii TaxID=28737 RepID=UPI0003F0E8EF|nr:PREDICTED: fetal and adult testis-expressed transcript protein homolog [Elephantulus edwardii]